MQYLRHPLKACWVKIRVDRLSLSQDGAMTKDMTPPETPDRRKHGMTYIRHPFARGSVLIAALFNTMAIPASVWAATPSLGSPMFATGWALVATGVIWWQWLHTCNGAPQRFLLGLGAAMILLLGAAGFASGLSRGLETSGAVGHAVLAALLFLPALVVAGSRHPRTAVGTS